MSPAGDNGTGDDRSGRPAPGSLSRRHFLVGASALAVGGVSAGSRTQPVSADVIADTAAAAVPTVALEIQPVGLPARQHAWGATLRLDAVPPATGLSSFESPAIDDYHLCLHLACDDERRLAAVEAALVHGERLDGATGQLQITDALRWRETRTGFVGRGLAAEHQDTSGIPHGRPVSEDSPLFMGFKSGLCKNQATEDSVTIMEGHFAQGTTMQVSYMRLRLDGWYRGLSYRERVARMYPPETTPDQVKHFTTDAESEPTLINQAIRRYGVIGHSQTSALARRQGKPLIIRRDFNTVDGGHAGLHFVSVQRSIEVFVTTRTPMNASGAHFENRAITATVNNGINDFIAVLKRANYILPTRVARSFPLLPGGQAALATPGDGATGGQR